MEEEGKQPQDHLKAIALAGQYHAGLAIGLKETIRSLEQQDAHVVVLASDCDEKNYVALVTALAKEAQVPLFKFGGGQKEIGKILGLCKYDLQGNPRKVIRCSSFAVKKRVPQKDIEGSLSSLLSA